MLHTFFDRLFDGWRANFTMQSESRQRAGFDALPDLDALRGDRDLLHVNALGAFDGDPATSWRHVVHGAPVLTAERRATPTTTMRALRNGLPMVDIPAKGAGPGADHTAAGAVEGQSGAARRRRRGADPRSS